MDPQKYEILRHSQKREILCLLDRHCISLEKPFIENRGEAILLERLAQ